jgi:iron complex transport system substrate-binding protein
MTNDAGKILGFWVRILLVFSLSTAMPAWAAVTITDEMGRRFEFKAPPKRIVVFSHYASEVICALGESGRIVGISNPGHAFLPELQKKPSIGKSTVDPTLEKIVELGPDLIISYQWTRKEVIARLEQWGIPVICFRVWTMDEVKSFISQMGSLLNRQERASELLGYIQSRTDRIESVTRSLREHEKPKVFMEVFVPYQTSPSGSYAMETPWGKYIYKCPMQIQLEIAGAVNCVGKRSSNSLVMSPEWVVEHNPDVFLKIPWSGTDADRTVDKMKRLRNEVLNRVELKDLTPVKQGKTFVINPILCAGPLQVVGIYYYAKWFHPELFSDISPRSFHQDMMRRFWGIELKGTWGYPEP